MERWTATAFKDAARTFLASLLLLATLAVTMAILLLVVAAYARNDDGRWNTADPKIREWMNQLKNGNNHSCCSDADGYDAKYTTKGNHYYVEINGKMHQVPDHALLKIPNLLGVAKVWHVPGPNGEPDIVCFIPGTQS